MGSSRVGIYCAWKGHICTGHDAEFRCNVFQNYGHKVKCRQWTCDFRSPNYIHSGRQFDCAGQWLAITKVLIRTRT